MSRWFRSYGFADVYDDLFLGAYPLDFDDVGALSHVGVRRVFNLTEDAEYRAGDRRSVEQALSAAGIEERRLSLPDYGGLPAAALETAVQEINAWLDDGIRTYIHCRAGWQRSAAVAAGVVAVRTGRDIEDALDYVQRRKPSADPLPHQREDLRRWWAERGTGGAANPARGDGRAAEAARGDGRAAEAERGDGRAADTDPGDASGALGK